MMPCGGVPAAGFTAVVDPAWAPRGFVDVLGAAAERLRDGPGGFGRGEVPNRHRLGRFLLGTLIVEGVPGGRRRGRPLGRRATRPHAPSGIVRSPRAAIATRHSPPLVSRRGVSPRARVKNWRARKLQFFFTRVPNFSQRNRAVARCQWSTGLEAAPDETSVSDPRVHSRRASCAVRKRGVRPRRAHSTTSVCGAPAVLDPSKTSPNLHRASLPDAPRRIRAFPAGYTPLPHVTRRASPRPEASRSRARAPRRRSRVFKPRREPPLTRHAPRGSARDDRRTMGLMCANPACTRGVRPKPSPRVPDSPPLGQPTPPRRPKGAHLQKPNAPKTTKRK